MKTQNPINYFAFNWPELGTLLTVPNQTQSTLTRSLGHARGIHRIPSFLKEKTKTSLNPFIHIHIQRPIFAYERVNLQ